MNIFIKKIILFQRNFLHFNCDNYIDIFYHTQRTNYITTDSNYARKSNIFSTKKHSTLINIHNIFPPKTARKVTFRFWSRVAKAHATRQSTDVSWRYQKNPWTDEYDIETHLRSMTITRWSRRPPTRRFRWPVPPQCTSSLIKDYCNYSDATQLGANKRR